MGQTPGGKAWQHTHLPRAWPGSDGPGLGVPWGCLQSTRPGAPRMRSWESWGLCRARQPCLAPSQGTRAQWSARWEAPGREAGLEGLHVQAAVPTRACLPPSPPVQDIVFQLQRFVSTMSKYYNDCYAVLRDADVFPIEVDLAHTTLAYGVSQDEFTDGEDEEDEDDEDTAAREPSRDVQGAAGSLDKGGSWCDS